MLNPFGSTPRMRLRFALLAVPLVLLTTGARAADWARFRGDNGAGVSPDSAAAPTEWSESKNLAWSATLPGPGSSSPIVVGDRVIVTCWTGADAPEMVRHVMAFDRKTGKQLWDTAISPATPDEPYRGMFAQHGYASHTPVSDGQRIYCFFGVSGVYAFDMDGKQVWGPVSVGTGFDPRGWGSASSPILYKGKVIVTAGSESKAMVALDKNDGHEVWNQPASGLAGLWGTPVILETPEGQTDIVLGVPGELWGVNPDTGKLRWYAVAGQGDSMCESAFVVDGVAYMLGERGGQMIAVKGGGKGDMTNSVLWAKNYQGRISTPVAADGLIYCAGGGQLTCVDAETGEQIYQERLAPPATAASDPNVQQAQAQEPAQAQDQGPRNQGGFGRGGGGQGRGGAFGGGGGRGGGGGMMSQDYSSPVIADGKLYFVRRNGETYVIQLGREFKTLAVNKFASDDGDFSASPAVSDGQVFIRSSKNLYCVAQQE